VRDGDQIASLEAFFDDAPVGLALLDDELRYVRVNARLEAFSGLSAADRAGRTPAEVLGEVGASVQESARKPLETGKPVLDVPIRGRTPGAPGVEREWLASFFPIAGGVGVVVIEITREVQARAANEMLARAARTMIASMRPEHVLDELLRAAVPALADAAGIHLVRADGSVELIAGTVTAREPVEVVRGGVLRVAPDRSAVVHPLSARGAVLGALTLTMGPSGRQYDAQLVELTGSLAAAAALALDNARLFNEQREISRALQRSLLPAALPEIDGVELAARYRPAGRSSHAGGDFYDVFPDHGEWWFTIGDVVGKGAEAAAITARVRATLEAAALRGDDPEEALRLADAALRRRPVGQFCSAVHGRFTPPAADGAVEVELLVAGHPPPLVVRDDGALEEVDAPGMLLGVAPEPAFGSASVRLAPGDALVLYTDGATELRGEDRFRGERVLRDTLLAMAGRPLSRIVEAVEHEALVLGGGELRDDLALLAIGAVRGEGQ
jgi:serine phosphatase RsbU (regulator of sigma subunit)